MTHPKQFFSLRDQSGHSETYLNFPLLEPVIQKIPNVNKSQILYFMQ